MAIFSITAVMVMARHMYGPLERVRRPKEMAQIIGLFESNDARGKGGVLGR